MRLLPSFKRRVVAGLGVGFAVASVLVSLSGSASAQQPPMATGYPVLQVANPSAGGLILPGDYVISGSAYDPAASQGSGVSHVDVFLGARDQGGLFLGSVVPGQNAIPGITPGSMAAQDSFQLTVTLPSNLTGGRDLFAYAYSSASGAETSVSTPVYIGVMPTGTVVPVSAETQHMPGFAAEGAQFSLANPNSGDVVLNGDYVVSGRTSPDFDRVTLFLDDRDAGGTALGTATPIHGSFSLNVTIPDWANGGHTFAAYAYSSITGQELKISVPIYVGAAPTPTPRPS